MTLDDMTEIEIMSMVEAGVPGDVAKGWVVEALKDLKSQDVLSITNIPWNGNNPFNGE